MRSWTSDAPHCRSHRCRKHPGVGTFRRGRPSRRSRLRSSKPLWSGHGIGALCRGARASSDARPCSCTSRSSQCRGERRRTGYGCRSRRSRAWRLCVDIEELVLVSGDGGFVPLLRAAESAGKTATVISAIARMSAGLAVAATERLTPMQLTPRLSRPSCTGSRREHDHHRFRHFKSANRRVVVLDPWSSEATIRLSGFRRPRR